MDRHIVFGSHNMRPTSEANERHILRLSRCSKENIPPPSILMCLHPELLYFHTSQLHGADTKTTTMRRSRGPADDDGEVGLRRGAARRDCGGKELGVEAVEKDEHDRRRRTSTTGGRGARRTVGAPSCRRGAATPSASACRSSPPAESELAAAELSINPTESGTPPSNRSLTPLSRAGAAGTATSNWRGRPVRV